MACLFSCLDDLLKGFGKAGSSVPVPRCHLNLYEGNPRPDIRGRFLLAPMPKQLDVVPRTVSHPSRSLSFRLILRSYPCRFARPTIAVFLRPFAAFFRFRSPQSSRPLPFTPLRSSERLASFHPSLFSSRDSVFPFSIPRPTALSNRSFRAYGTGGSATLSLPSSSVTHYFPAAVFLFAVSALPTFFSFSLFMTP